jgi:hypothetical protein
MNGESRVAPIGQGVPTGRSSWPTGVHDVSGAAVAAGCNWPSLPPASQSGRSSDEGAILRRRGARVEWHAQARLPSPGRRLLRLIGGDLTLAATSVWGRYPVSEVVIYDQA